MSLLSSLNHHSSLSGKENPVHVFISTQPRCHFLKPKNVGYTTNIPCCVLISVGVYAELVRVVPRELLDDLVVADTALAVEVQAGAVVGHAGALAVHFARRIARFCAISMLYVV